MSLLKILPNAIDTTQNFVFGSISATSITANGTSVSTSTVPAIANVWIADSSYNVLDDTAANTTGGYIVVRGSNFQTGSMIIVGSNNATSTTVVNSSIIRAQVPSAASGTYPVYLVGPDGTTSIKVNGLTHSSFPAWGTSATLANTSTATSFSVSLSANSDSTITYSNTSALPEGTTLLSNGYFYGMINVASSTTYSFGVKATDAENQDATRTFSMTTNAIPPLPTNVIFYMSGQGTVGDVPSAKFANGTSVLMTQSVGAVSYSTTQAKYGTTSIGKFSNTNRRLEISNTVFALGTSDLTIEAWFRPDNALSERLFFGITNGGDGNQGFEVLTDNSRKVFVHAFGAYAVTDGFAGGGDLTAGAWNHIALTRSGSLWTTWVNGNQYQTFTNGGSVSAQTLLIGSTSSHLQYPDFYINDLRISNVARYSSNFTPPGYFNY